MQSTFVVTIGRQFGSGGREVGKQLAKLLGIDFYDRKLITEAARRSGLSHDFFEKEDEKVPSTMWHSLYPGFGFTPGIPVPRFGHDAAFTIQSDTIRDLAAKASCVIVGRCADYVLRDEVHCINTFIQAPLERRIEAVSKRLEITTKEAEDTIARIDKSRAAYYDFYTDKKWGSALSYHLSVDSSLIGIEATAAMIAELVKKTLK